MPNVNLSMRGLLRDAGEIGRRPSSRATSGELVSVDQRAGCSLKEPSFKGRFDRQVNARGVRDKK